MRIQYHQNCWQNSNLEQMMKKYYVQERHKNKLLEIIHKELPGCKVYLFGSRARGDHQEGSDIDLALDIGRPLEIREIGRIKEKIEETTIPQTVDIADLHTASEKFKQEIENEGILWEN